MWYSRYMCVTLDALGHYHNKAEAGLVNPRFKNIPYRTIRYDTSTQQQMVSNLSQQQREIRQRRALSAAAAPCIVTRSIKKFYTLSSYVCGRSSLAIRGLANRNICEFAKSGTIQQKPISCPPLAVSNTEHSANLAYQVYCKRNKQEGFEPPHIRNPFQVWTPNKFSLATLNSGVILLCNFSEVESWFF